MPTRQPEVARTLAGERVLVKDRTAFKQMTDSGLRPAKLRGAAELQRHAESKFEVESGRILPPKIRDRAIETHTAISRGEVPNL
jgi:hypothetical protein